MSAEIADAGSANQDPFRSQEPALELEVPAVAAKLAGRRDHPMAGNIALPAVAHDVANRTRGTRASCGHSDVAVGRHLADGDSSHDGDHSRGEFGHRRQLQYAQLKLRATGVETANCEPRTANCELRTANREPRTANRELRTANCELRTANRELRTANRESRTAKHESQW